MSKLEITQEIRSKISQLDDLANEIYEYLQENEPDGGFDDESENLFETLEELGGDITDFQEHMGWI